MSLIASTSRTARHALRVLPTSPASLPSSSRSVLIPFSRSSSSTSSASSSSSALAKGGKKPISSCPEGTVLTGLNILKDQPEVTAMADDAYPDWLWKLLDKPSKGVATGAGAGAEGEGSARTVDQLKSREEFMEEKKKLRASNRANIKASNYLKTT